LSDKRDRVLLGEIGAAQGLKGEVRLRSYTQDPAAIAGYGTLEDEQGRAIEIERVRVTPNALIAHIKGVTTREGAEALTHTKLSIERARLPEREEDEWYHLDLIGLTVVRQDGEKIGSVVGVHNFGAGDLIEIDPVSGGATVLVPFTRDTVPEVDVEGGRITIAPPEGLFD
jgi:16S rRNA processing protein RimM